MRPIRVSIAWKILIMILAVMLVSGLSLTKIWLNKSEEDYQSRQSKIKERDQKMLGIFVEQSLINAESRFQSFIKFKEISTNSDQGIQHQVEQQLEYMQLHWQLSQLWILDPQLKPLYSSTERVPEYVIQESDRAKESFRTRSSLVCDATCEYLVAMPFLTKDSWLLLASKNSLVELMGHLSLSTDAGVAFVKSQNGAAELKNLQVKQPVSKVKAQEYTQMLLELDQQVTLSEVIKGGAQIQFAGKTLFINLLPFEGDQHPAYLMMVHDLTELAESLQKHQLKVILVAILSLCGLVILSFSLMQKLRHRILNLTTTLPLLASKDYHEFKLLQSDSKSVFIDELNLLQDSARELGEHLEELDHKVLENTQSLERMAMYDELTQLPNKNKLFKTVTDLRQQGVVQPISLILLDLENFRKVNDSQGHEVGDLFLNAAADRLKSYLNNRDTLYRYGGDEFAILNLDALNQESLLEKSDGIRRGFNQPLVVDQFKFFINLSIGATQSECSDAKELIRQADMALHDAKRKEILHLTLYSQELDNRTQGKTLLEGEVKQALAEGQFRFALQPQIDLRTQKLVGLEALIRWFHPEKGFIPPDRFLPVLEHSENILKIGRWGLKRTFSIVRRLRKMGFVDIKVAVNMTAEQLLDTKLLMLVAELAGEDKQALTQIEMELTEHSLVADIDKSLQVMEELGEYGIRFSIDDFGTGYSSLSYLKKLPVNVIKIDRSFVNAMESSKADYQIVASTIAMVKRLGHLVIAEGIETENQQRLLSELGCDIGQGYLYSKPVLEREFFLSIEDKAPDYCMTK